MPIGVRTPRRFTTDISIGKLPLSKSRLTYWDEGGLPGFGVRVGARRKTFVLVLNCGHRIKLGQYPLISLKDARQEALRRCQSASMAPQILVPGTYRGFRRRSLILTDDPRSRSTLQQSALHHVIGYQRSHRQHK